MPISYGDAQPLLASLTGPCGAGKMERKFANNISYCPGASKVHLKLQFDWKLVDCLNVIAKIKGSEFPDEWD